MQGSGAEEEVRPLTKHLGGGSNGGWWHVAAVFDKPFTNFTFVTNATNVITISTNALRIYLDGAEQPRQATA